MTHRCSRALAITLLAALGLHALPACAQWTRGEHFYLLSGHVGTDKREGLEWFGMSFGWYTGELTPQALAPAPVRDFINRDGVYLGIDFTLADLNEEYLTRAHWDVSIVPKVRWYFTRHWYGSLGLGVAWNDIRYQDTESTQLKLGSNLFFAPEGSLGYEFRLGDRPVFTELYYTHRSNAGIGTGNASLNLFMLALGTRFGTTWEPNAWGDAPLDWKP